MLDARSARRFGLSPQLLASGGLERLHRVKKGSLLLAGGKRYGVYSRCTSRTSILGQLPLPCSWDMSMGSILPGGFSRHAPGPPASCRPVPAFVERNPDRPGAEGGAKDKDLEYTEKFTLCSTEIKKLIRKVNDLFYSFIIRVTLLNSISNMSFVQTMVIKIYNILHQQHMNLLAGTLLSHKQCNFSCNSPFIGSHL